MHITDERIQSLREKMKEYRMDAYLVPTADFHESEYVGEYFKCRKYLTGFTGSAGTAVITMNEACLWVDGRYFVQAAAELKGSCVKMMKMGQEGVPSVQEYLEENVPEGGCLGFDGRVVNSLTGLSLEKNLREKSARIACTEDLVGMIWQERPELSSEPAWILEEKYAGKPAADKIADVRAAMKKVHATVHVLTALDDIAWLLNIRGGDIHCCPVVLSYLVMTKTEIRLFANEKAFQTDVLEALEKDGVTLFPYDGIYEYVKTFKKDKKVLLCKKKVNSRLVSNIPADTRILDEENLTLLPKATKNPVEVENERIAHIRDGVAVTKFIYWLKKNVGRIPITELSAAEKLYEFRSEQEDFIDNSFDPIIAYGKHAAIVHYFATPETDIPLEPSGFLLADTGGHYKEGTTDITRTVVMGPTTEEEKKYFTAVLRGTLNLGAARFLHGCTGVNLDILARQPLWEMGENFKHGTGHGVGYLLNVHEGPNSFRWKIVPGGNAVLEEGMITSDEPGYYREDGFGIRHENLMVCKKAEKTEYGQFMCFEFLTMVPFDLDGVVPELMSARERNLLNDYHAQVYEKISPYLNEEEKEWLKDATRAI